MSIKRYGTRHDWIEGGVIGIGPDDNGRYVLYTDHAAELHYLFSTLADIRAALGVGEKPMLGELAGIVHEVREQAVQGGVNIAEWRHKASIFRLAMVWWRNRCRSHNERREALRRACAGHLEQAARATKAEAERDAAVRERDAAVEVLKKCLAKGHRWHPCDPVVVESRAVLAKIEGERNA